MSVVLIIIISALVQSILTCIVIRKKNIRIRIYMENIILLWISFDYYILSVTKYYLGYKWENLLDSFWNAQTVTFIHYSIPLILFSVGINLFLFFLKRELLCKILKLYSASLYISFFFMYFITREVSNRAVTYCLILHICLMIVLIIATWRQQSINGKLGFGEKAQKIFFPICTWLMLFSISTPVELYLNNSDDFSLSFWTFFPKLVVVSIVVLCLFVILGSRCLTDQLIPIFNTVLFGMVFMGYIQGMFLNGKMNQLDGVEQDWNRGTVIINVSVWLICFIALFIIYKVNSSILSKVIKYGCIYLTLIQLVTTAFSIVTSPNTAAKHEYALTTENFCSIDQNDNIIVFILDKFDGRIIDEIKEEDEDFLDPLMDFVYFPNATSEYCPTENSIPFLLTGTKWKPDRTDRYTTYAYDESALVNCLYDNNYKLDIYTDNVYVDESMVDKISNFHSDIKKNCNAYDLFSMMNIWSRYRFAPFIVKKYYFYYTYELDTLLTDDSLYSIHNDWKIYQQLTQEKLHISENGDKGTFKFIHMKGAHPPFVLSEDLHYTKYEDRRADEMGDKISQAKGSLKVVYEYLSQLKEIGKYDDATIIITADHGVTQPLHDENGNMIDVSCPVMYVKDSAHNSVGKGEVSEAPVCHEDVISLITNKIEKQSVKKSFFDYNEKDERNRVMYRIGIDDYTKYGINGNARDLSSWKVLEYGARVDTQK